MKTKTFSALAAIVSTAFIAFPAFAENDEMNEEAAAEEVMEASLYERLGGYEAISAVANDFAPKLFDDPQVGVFFRGMGTDTRKSFIQKNTNLVCAVTGGPCKIISRPANVVHAGLGITESDFNVVVGHLVDTLDKFQVPDQEKEELLAIIGSLKPDIVEVFDE